MQILCWLRKHLPTTLIILFLLLSASLSLILAGRHTHQSNAITVHRATLKPKDDKAHPSVAAATTVQPKSAPVTSPVAASTPPTTTQPKVDGMPPQAPLTAIIMDGPIAGTLYWHTKGFPPAGGFLLYINVGCNGPWPPGCLTTPADIIKYSQPITLGQSPLNYSPTSFEANFFYSAMVCQNVNGSCGITSNVFILNPPPPVLQ